MKPLDIVFRWAMTCLYIKKNPVSHNEGIPKNSMIAKAS